MKVVSTQIAQPTTIIWNGKEELTGIYKVPVDHPLELGMTDVAQDAVIDRKYHGGVDKACYLYSADHYAYWRELYPGQELPYGMFGENLTVEGLDETQMIVGEVYQLGTARVQVSEPRQPCYKLGIRFGDQRVLKQFVNSSYSGVYVRVLQPGQVQRGDELVRIEAVAQGFTIAEVYALSYAKATHPEQVQRLVADEYLPQYLKEKLLAKFADTH
ncbi:sulfurase [Reichenbachiella sp. 5M10]|uniref:MOSC domain-containing protein n=1 Tax=Reichenbachiella sp. 5M10 TaxID=1889772 RepID=UPI000C14CD87|nr:MOSC domain-containing protein [Reichenbachiella sp. 5M10]PIB36189.1 sulfurase [Reichenbachiella sp. 5M10]